MNNEVRSCASGTAAPMVCHPAVPVAIVLHSRGIKRIANFGEDDNEQSDTSAKVRQKRPKLDARGSFPVLSDALDPPPLSPSQLLTTLLHVGDASASGSCPPLNCMADATATPTSINNSPNILDEPSCRNIKQQTDLATSPHAEASSTVSSISLDGDIRTATGVIDPSLEDTPSPLEDSANHADKPCAPCADSTVSLDACEPDPNLLVDGGELTIATEVLGKNVQDALEGSVVRSAKRCAQDDDTSENRPSNLAKRQRVEPPPPPPQTDGITLSNVRSRASCGSVSPPLSAVALPAGPDSKLTPNASLTPHILSLPLPPADTAVPPHLSKWQTPMTSPLGPQTSQYRRQSRLSSMPGPANRALTKSCLFRGIIIDNLARDPYRQSPEWCEELHRMNLVLNAKLHPMYCCTHEFHPSDPEYDEEWPHETWSDEEWSDDEGGEGSSTMPEDHTSIIGGHVLSSNGMNFVLADWGEDWQPPLIVPSQSPNYQPVSVPSQKSETQPFSVPSQTPDPHPPLLFAWDLGHATEQPCDKFTASTEVLIAS